MRVRVDLDRCQGYGNCVVTAPDVFDLSDDGLVVLLEEHPSAERAEDVLNAAKLCPVQAIAVDEPAGRP